MKNRPYIPILVAIAATLPGLSLRLAGIHFRDPIAVAVAGAAIVAASFLLLWTCDAAQSEISQALALAAVALVAVLPEYAVDMYFTWQAGKFPDSDYASFATANMTGANRLLIGVAWALIVALYWARHRREVVIEQARRPCLPKARCLPSWGFWRRYPHIFPNAPKCNVIVKITSNAR